MKSRPASPIQDPGRLLALRATGLLDSAPEDPYDRLTRLGSALLHTPISALSLVDDRRAFFKSHVGLPPRWQIRHEAPLSHSFCKLVVSTGKRLITGDARHHRWTRNNPAIHEEGILAYAGIPIRSANGQVLGSFCVMDTRPHEWAKKDISALADLAAVAQDELIRSTQRNQGRAGGPAIDASASNSGGFLFQSEMIRPIVEGSLAGVAVIQDNRFRYVSPTFAAMVGYSPEELRALESVLEIVDAEYREGVADNLRKRVSGEVEHLQYAFRARHKDGEAVELDVFGARSSIAGKPAVVGMAIDITSRVQAEAALRESERRFRGIFNHTLQLIWLISPEGVLLEVNETALDFAGLAHEEIIGRPAWGAPPWMGSPEMQTRFQEAIRQAADGQIVRYEMEVRRGDDQIATVDFSLRPVREDAGPVVLIIAEGRDITPRKKAEEALRQNEERYHRLFDDDLTGNVISTPEGKILACNPAFVRIFGYESVEEVLRTDAARFHASVEARETWLEEVRTNRRLELQESELVRKDGQTIQVLENAAGTCDELGRLTEIRRYLFDITRRKQAEDELQRSEERFRTIIENAGDIVHIVDEQGIILYISPSVEKVLGYRPEEMIGRFSHEFVHPDDAPRTNETFEEVIQRPGAERSIELRLRHRDGSWRTAEVRGKVLDDSTGTRIAIVHSHDITERMQVQEALSRSEERFRLVARATNDVLWEWDIASGDLRWSEAAPKVFRYAAAEVGPSIEWWVERVHLEDRERVMNDLQHVVHGAGEVWSSEYRFLRGDGVYATILDRGYVVREEDGSPSRVIGSMMDITERRRSEEIHRLLARVSALLERSLDPGITLPTVVRAVVPVLADYCAIDLLEGAHLRRAAAAHAVLAQEALLESGEPRPMKSAGEGDPVATVVRDRKPILVADAVAYFLKARATDPEHQMRLELLGDHSLMIIPLVIREEVLGVITLANAESGRHYGPVDLLVAEDLGSRIALALVNARLYRNAQQAVLDREQILGVVSHDLRNPLHTIKLSADLLHDASEERRSGNLQWVDMIGRSADQMERMIKDLLDLSSIDAGGFTVSPADHEVSAILNEVCASFQPLAEQKSITLRCDPGTAPATAWVDSHRILRVFSNLLGNALKFTPERGTITLRAGCAEQEICFSVSDTGPGIPAEHLPHVFDRYWQARKGDRRGSGLGLSIARGIVEAHGGRIWVESTPGEGATFFFTVASTGRERGVRGSGSDSRP